VTIGILHDCADINFCVDDIREMLLSILLSDLKAFEVNVHRSDS